MRSDKSNLDLGIGVLDGLGEADVTGEAGRAGEQHQELIVLRDLNGLFTREVMRWGVKEARSFEHTGRISQPHGIPIRLNFTRSGPPRPSASVEILKRRRIQRQRCQRHALSLKDSRLACQGDQARSARRAAWFSGTAGSVGPHRLYRRLGKQQWDNHWSASSDDRNYLSCSFSCSWPPIRNPTKPTPNLTARAATVATFEALREGVVCAGGDSSHMGPVDRDSALNSPLEPESMGDPDPETAGSVNWYFGTTGGLESTGRLIGNSRLRGAGREFNAGDVATDAKSF